MRLEIGFCNLNNPAARFLKYNNSNIMSMLIGYSKLILLTRTGTNPARIQKLGFGGGDMLYRKEVHILVNIQEYFQALKIVTSLSMLLRRKQFHYVHV